MNLYGATLRNVKEIKQLRNRDKTDGTVTHLDK